jgi:hypothetical protein
MLGWSKNIDPWSLAKREKVASQSCHCGVHQLGNVYIYTYVNLKE